MKSNHVGMIKNLAYSFFAYALPTAVLQFVVQPMIAKRIGAEANGQYLTLMSLNFFLVGITASVLNTVRLLQDKRYDEKKIKGDFNIFFLFYVLIIAILMPAGYAYYIKSIRWVDIGLYIAIGWLYLYHDYIFAQYRLKLQYNKILINNVIMVFGYGVGLLVFMLTSKWQFVFICAYLFTFVYDYCNTDYIKEPVRKTFLFNETLGLIIPLTVSSFLGSSVTYFDKLLLYPLLGGTSVSIYNTATIVGKILLMVSAPLSSVFLSYLVHENELKVDLRFKQYATIVALLIVGYATCVIVGDPLTSYLYPDWAFESQKLIPITVAASLFLLLGNCINTVIVRFFKAHLQIVIQSIHLALYLVLSLIGLKTYGLFGFCMGVMISNCIRLILIIVIIFRKPNTLFRTNNNINERRD